MKLNNKNELHEFLYSLWEYEDSLNRREYVEMDINEEINMLTVTKLLGRIEYTLYFHNDTSTKKAVPSELKKLLDTTSIETIIIQKNGYCITTDIFNVVYDFNGGITGTEEV